jgi:putative tryptophan/tyrosine transport system permease protein
MSSWWFPIETGMIQGLIFACVVLGLGVALRLFQFPDLTVEGSFMIGGAAFATLRTHDISFAVALVVAIGIGMAAGAITATLHMYLKLNKFLAGILVIATTYSLALRIMQGSNVSLLNTSSPLDVAIPLNRLGPPDTHLGDLLILGALVFCLATSIILLFRSRVGVQLRATGCNPQFAQSIGIFVPAYLIAGIALTNGLAALSGSLLATYQGFCDVGMGQGILVICLASLAIGERFATTKRLPDFICVVIAACLGSMAYQIAVAIAVRLGLPPTDLKIATAILVLCVVAFRSKKNAALMDVT